MWTKEPEFQKKMPDLVIEAVVHLQILISLCPCFFSQFREKDFCELFAIGL